MKPTLMCPMQGKVGWYMILVWYAIMVLVVSQYRSYHMAVCYHPI